MKTAADETFQLQTVKDKQDFKISMDVVSEVLNKSGKIIRLDSESNQILFECMQDIIDSSFDFFDNEDGTFNFLFKTQEGAGKKILKEGSKEEILKVSNNVKEAIQYLLKNSKFINLLKNIYEFYNKEDKKVFYMCRAKLLYGWKDGSNKSCVHVTTLKAYLQETDVTDRIQPIEGKEEVSRISEECFPITLSARLADMIAVKDTCQRALVAVRCYVEYDEIHINSHSDRLMPDCVADIFNKVHSFHDNEDGTFDLSFKEKKGLAQKTSIVSKAAKEEIERVFKDQKFIHFCVNLYKFSNVTDHEASVCCAYVVFDCGNDIDGDYLEGKIGDITKKDFRILMRKTQEFNTKGKIKLVDEQEEVPQIEEILLQLTFAKTSYPTDHQETEPVTSSGEVVLSDIVLSDDVDDEIKKDDFMMKIVAGKTFQLQTIKDKIDFDKVVDIVSKVVHKSGKTIHLDSESNQILFECVQDIIDSSFDFFDNGDGTFTLLFKPQEGAVVEEIFKVSRSVKEASQYLLKNSKFINLLRNIHKFSKDDENLFFMCSSSLSNCWYNDEESLDVRANRVYGEKIKVTHRIQLVDRKEKVSQISEEKYMDASLIEEFPIELSVLLTDIMAVKDACNCTLVAVRNYVEYGEIRINSQSHQLMPDCMTEIIAKVHSFYDNKDGTFTLSFKDAKGKKIDKSIVKKKIVSKADKEEIERVFKDQKFIHFCVNLRKFSNVTNHEASVRFAYAFFDFSDGSHDIDVSHLKGKIEDSTYEESGVLTCEKQEFKITGAIKLVDGYEDEVPQIKEILFTYGTSIGEVVKLAVLMMSWNVRFGDNVYLDNDTKQLCSEWLHEICDKSVVFFSNEDGTYTVSFHDEKGAQMLKIVVSESVKKGFQYISKRNELVDVIRSMFQISLTNGELKDGERAVVHYDSFNSGLSTDQNLCFYILGDNELIKCEEKHRNMNDGIIRGKVTLLPGKKKVSQIRETYFSLTNIDREVHCKVPAQTDVLNTTNKDENMFNSNKEANMAQSQKDSQDVTKVTSVDTLQETSSDQTDNTSDSEVSETLARTGENMFNSNKEANMAQSQKDSQDVTKVTSVDTSQETSSDQTDNTSDSEVSKKPDQLDAPNPKNDRHSSKKRVANFFLKVGDAKRLAEFNKVILKIKETLLKILINNKICVVEDGSYFFDTESRRLKSEFVQEVLNKMNFSFCREGKHCGKWKLDLMIGNQVETLAVTKGAKEVLEKYVLKNPKFVESFCSNLMLGKVQSENGDFTAYGAVFNYSFASDINGNRFLKCINEPIAMKIEKGKILMCLTGAKERRAEDISFIEDIPTKEYVAFLHDGDMVYSNQVMMGLELVAHGAQMGIFSAIVATMSEDVTSDTFYDPKSGLLKQEYFKRFIDDNHEFVEKNGKIYLSVLCNRDKSKTTVDNVFGLKGWENFKNFKERFMCLEVTKNVKETIKRLIEQPEFIEAICASWKINKIQSENEGFVASCARVDYKISRDIPIYKNCCLGCSVYQDEVVQEFTIGKDRRGGGMFISCDNWERARKSQFETEGVQFATIIPPVVTLPTTTSDQTGNTSGSEMPETSAQMEGVKFAIDTKDEKCQRKVVEGLEFFYAWIRKKTFGAIVKAVKCDTLLDSFYDSATGRLKPEYVAQFISSISDFIEFPGGGGYFCHDMMPNEHNYTLHLRDLEGYDLEDVLARWVFLRLERDEIAAKEEIERIIKQPEFVEKVCDFFKIDKIQSGVVVSCFGVDMSCSTEASGDDFFECTVHRDEVTEEFIIGKNEYGKMCINYYDEEALMTQSQGSSTLSTEQQVRFALMTKDDKCAKEVQQGLKAVTGVLIRALFTTVLSNSFPFVRNSKYGQDILRIASVVCNHDFSSFFQIGDGKYFSIVDGNKKKYVDPVTKKPVMVTGAASEEIMRLIKKPEFIKKITDVYFNNAAFEDGKLYMPVPGVSVSLGNEEVSGNHCLDLAITLDKENEFTCDPNVDKYGKYKQGKYINKDGTCVRTIEEIFAPKEPKTPEEPEVTTDTGSAGKTPKYPATPKKTSEEINAESGGKTPEEPAVTIDNGSDDKTPKEPKTPKKPAEEINAESGGKTPEEPAVTIDTGNGDATPKEPETPEEPEEEINTIPKVAVNAPPVTEHLDEVTSPSSVQVTPPPSVQITPPPAVKDIEISLNLENKNDKLEDEKDKQDATTGAMGILNGAAKSMRESFASTVKPGGTFEVASEHLTPETVTKAIKSSFSFAQSTEKNKFILSFADDTEAPLTVTENVKKEIDRIVEGPKFVNAVSETVLFDKAYLKDGKRRVFFPEVAVSLDKDDGENHFLKCTVDRANAQSILVDADRIEMVNEQGKRSERKKQEATIADRVVVFLQSLLVTVLALFIFFIQFLYIFKIIIKQNKTLSIKSLIKLFVKESAIVGINLGGSVAGVFINPFRSGDKVAVYKKQGLRGYFKGGFVEMESEATQDIMKELIISYGKINDEKLNDKEKKQIWDKLNRFVMAICDNIESIQKDTNKIFKDIYGFEQFNANMTRVLGVLTELKSKCFDVKDKDSVRSEDLSKYMYEGFGVNSDESFEKVLTHGGLWDNMKHVLDPAAHKLFSFCNFDLMKKGNEGQNVEQGQSANQPQVSSGTDIPHDIKVDSTTQEQPVSRNRRQG